MQGSDLFSKLLCTVSPSWRHIHFLITFCGERGMLARIVSCARASVCVCSVGFRGVPWGTDKKLKLGYMVLEDAVALVRHYFGVEIPPNIEQKMAARCRVESLLKPIHTKHAPTRVSDFPSTICSSSCFSRASLYPV